jgi:transcription antitermination factor NusG
VEPPAELYVEPRWYACYTRARAEKRVEQLLAGRGVESYLPVAPLERQWKDRRKVVEFPLFRGYVFGRFTLRDVHAVLMTPGVATIVRVAGYPTPIPDEEIANIRLFAERIASCGLQPEPVPFLEAGQWVRVLDGPLEGVVGIVLERRGRRRVLVGLKAIGQGLEVDIAAASLEPVSAAA